ncbi:hypothetical protein M885DRAFT_501458 [Pelagophyceae sp. CCMP2097]|nr:hypothetical protein M885DRAFT_501458 [Pelagophyceae sp. CCMP2097]
MQDWAPDEVVKELRVQCIPCKNSWKVTGSSVKKAFGKHHDKAHPEEAASRLAMLIDAIKSSEHLAFEEGAFIIVPASCAMAPPPLPQHPPSTLQEPDALEVVNDLWRFIATLPSHRHELNGNVQEALKSFYAAHPRHSPRSAAARASTQRLTANFLIVAAVAQSAAPTQVAAAPPVFEFVRTKKVKRKHLVEGKKDYKFKHELADMPVGDGSSLSARSFFQTTLRADDFTGGLTLLCDGTIYQQHPPAPVDSAPSKKKQKASKTPFVPTEASKSAALWAKERRSLAPA